MILFSQEYTAFPASLRRDRYMYLDDYIYKIHEQVVQKMTLLHQILNQFCHIPLNPQTQWIYHMLIKYLYQNTSQVYRPTLHEIPILNCNTYTIVYRYLARCFIAITSDHEVVWYFFAWYKTLGKGMVRKFLLQHQCLIIIIIVQKNLFSSLFL